MFCIECGKKIEDNVKFCPHCGLMQTNKSNNKNEIINEVKPIKISTFKKNIFYSISTIVLIVLAVATSFAVLTPRSQTSQAVIAGNNIEKDPVKNNSSTEQALYRPNGWWFHSLKSDPSVSKCSELYNISDVRTLNKFSLNQYELKTLVGKLSN